MYPFSTGQQEGVCLECRNNGRFWMHNPKWTILYHRRHHKYTLQVCISSWPQWMYHRNGMSYEIFRAMPRMSYTDDETPINVPFSCLTDHFYRYLSMFLLKALSKLIPHFGYKFLLSKILWLRRRMLDCHTWGRRIEPFKDRFYTDNSAGWKNNSYTS